MLRGGVARALAAGERVIDRPHLSPSRSGPVEEDVIDGDLQAATLEFQRRRVEAALEASGGNRTKAAEALGVSRQWLHRLMSRWDIA